MPKLGGSTLLCTWPYSFFPLKVVLEQLAALKAHGEKRDVELRERNAVRTTELTSQVRELAKSFARKKECFEF